MALGLAPAAGGARERPSLRPLALQPLEVRGTHFADSERIVVTVLGGAGHTARHVTADGDGNWTVRFPTLNAKGRHFSVRAVGNRGSAALWMPRFARPGSGVTTPTVPSGTA